MNGQNKETPEGFIKGLGHPRKKELAALLIGGEATIESLAAAGFGRINVMEMAREIRQNVTGMEEFNFEWGRKVDVEVAKPVAEVAPAPEVVPETTPAPEVTPEAEVPVAPVVEVTPEVTATPEVTPEAEVPTAEITPEVTPEATQG